MEEGKLILNNPWMLVLLAIPLSLLILRIRKGSAAPASLRWSFLPAAGSSWRIFLLRHEYLIHVLALSLFIMAMARPQRVDRIIREGIDIVISMDLSGSMLAQDFEPNRLGAAKETAVEFVRGRKDDRIGLVLFARTAFTQSPVTTDHKIIEQLINEIEYGMLPDGTAIGMGLMTAVNRLKSNPERSKVAILLSDGMNTAGEIQPEIALEAAKQHDVTVYTIGVGTKGLAPYPIETPFGITTQRVEVEIDEELLTQIAEETGGSYFRATDKESLKEIYRQIDQMEKSKVEDTIRARKAELFRYFMLPGLILLLSWMAFRYSILKTLT